MQVLFTTDLQWPWSQAHVKYTGNMGLNSNKGLNLSTVVRQGSEVYLENKWSWDNTNRVPQLLGAVGQQIKWECRVINESTHQRVTRISVTEVKTKQKQIKNCAVEKWDCWSNFTLVQPVFVVCLWAKNRVGLSFKFKISTLTTTSVPDTEPTPQPIFVSTRPSMCVTPYIFNIGPYVTENTGQQQILFNLSYSLKWVELTMQINISAIKPACSPFLGTYCAGGQHG